MVTINLQWLALPFALWAIWKFVQCVRAVMFARRMPDVGPTLGMVSAIHCCSRGLLGLALAWLIWQAFRT